MKKLLTNKFIQGGAVLMMVNLLVSLSNYFFHTLSARVLAPEGYGEIATMFSYLVLLSFPTGVLAELLIQKLGKHATPTVLAAQIFRWFVVTLKKHWYINLILLCFIPAMPWLTKLSGTTAYLIIPLLMISFVTAFYDGALQGLHRFGVFAIIGLIAVLIKLAGPFISLYYAQSALVIIVTAIAGSYVAKLALSNFVLNKTILIAKAAPINASIGKLLKSKQLWLTVLSTAAIAGMQNLDLIFVKQRFDATDAGLYAGWLLFSKLIMYIFGPLITMSYIFFSSKKDEKYHQVAMMFALLLFVIVGVVSNIVYGIYAKSMILMLLGEKYLVIYPYLEWASLYGTLTAMIMFLNYYFLAKEQRIGIVFFISLPFYLLALNLYAKLATDVIYISILYSMCIISLFLLAFFGNR
ncbi:MAG: lipopolysaccharide biosynthesis protein, partial [Weeksellaceae bacterium]